MSGNQPTHPHTYIHTLTDLMCISIHLSGFGVEWNWQGFFKVLVSLTLLSRKAAILHPILHTVWEMKGGGGWRRYGREKAKVTNSEKMEMKLCNYTKDNKSLRLGHTRKWPSKIQLTLNNDRDITCWCCDTTSYPIMFACVQNNVNSLFVDNTKKGKK